MPIRINLLAEAQALEELRRRDPVKRAIWAGILLVLTVLVWSSSLWLKGLIGKSELNHLQVALDTHTNDYQRVMANQQKLSDVRHKLAALQQLATNRFLNGNMLNALQRATVDDVCLTRLKTSQIYTLSEGTQPSTNNDRIIPGKPAMATEKITLTLEAKDFSPNPGDAIPKFKDTVANTPYFQQMLGKGNEVRLKDYGTPQTGPDGRPFRTFTLECLYPEKTR